MLEDDNIHIYRCENLESYKRSVSEEWIFWPRLEPRTSYSIAADLLLFHP
jgi:hypothetical protein